MVGISGLIIYLSKNSVFVKNPIPSANTYDWAAEKEIKLILCFEKLTEIANVLVQ